MRLLGKILGTDTPMVLVTREVAPAVAEAGMNEEGTAVKVQSQSSFCGRSQYENDVRH